MLKKIMSLLLALMLTLSLSVSSASAEVFYNEDADSAYAYLEQVLEDTADVNELCYTEESYSYFTAARESAETTLTLDGGTKEQYIAAANELKAAFESLEAYILGDADENGILNIKDATLIQKSLAMLDYRGKVNKFIVEANRDEHVDIRDATAVQKYVTDLETSRFVGYGMDVVMLQEELVEKYSFYTWMSSGLEPAYADFSLARDYAEEVYLSDTKDAGVIRDAIARLKAAYKELVATSSGYVRYFPVDDIRIGYYNDSYETCIEIIKSVDQAKEVLSKIDKGYYEMVELDEKKYNDEFFEDHALIMCFAVVGGTGCSRYINNVEIVGNTLCIYAKRSDPEFIPCDMNYRVAILDVVKSDIAYVTNCEYHSETI